MPLAGRMWRAAVLLAFKKHLCTPQLFRTWSGQAVGGQSYTQAVDVLRKSVRVELNIEAQGLGDTRF